MIRIHGHSDDVLEVEGDFIGENEYSSFDVRTTLRIEDPVTMTKVFITADYAISSNAGVWSFLISMVDEDVKIPRIDITNFYNGYSPQLTIDCSPQTTVIEVKE